jgi:uncharacterized protein with FMN-binding domain
MKRALLIAGGTLGGLGAVMAITPPQFSTSNTAGLGAGIGAIGGATSTPAASKSSTAVATRSASAKPVTTKKATATKAATASATADATASATPVATQTTAAPVPASKGVSGTFTGPTVNVNYGNVQVQITVKDGKITDATALQAPSGRNDRWTNMALPILKKQTLAAQSASIQGASGASYTSYGWYTSLQGALAKAGL